MRGWAWGDRMDINSSSSLQDSLDESMEMRDTVVLVLMLTACLGLCSGAPVTSTADQEKAEVNTFRY